MFQMLLLALGDKSRAPSCPERFEEGIGQALPSPLRSICHGEVDQMKETDRGRDKREREKGRGRDRESCSALSCGTKLKIGGGGREGGREIAISVSSHAS